MSLTHEPQVPARPAFRQQFFDPDRTAAIYENPANGWREGVPKLAWLWMLLFGVFYMGARSLWRPLGVSLAVLFVTMAVFWPLLIIVAPLVWVTTAAQAQAMFRAHYMRQGWNEIDPWEQQGVEL